MPRTGSDRSTRSGSGYHAGLMMALMAMLAPVAIAQEDVITLEGVRIRGGQEVPLVLYLVPWQPPEARSLDRPDEQRMLTRPIEPLERAEFRRLLGYHQRFQALNRTDSPPENANTAPE